METGMIFPRKLNYSRSKFIKTLENETEILYVVSNDPTNSIY